MLRPEVAIPFAPVRSPFRRKNLSPRLLPFYLVAALAFWLAEPTPGRFALGGVFVIAGMVIRAWGAGHLVKTDELIVTGPYAHLRHPLYAGTLLLGVGFGIICGTIGLVVLVVFFLPVFWLYYAPYKERVEGDRLEARYGEAYAAYRAAVPALFPSLSGWRPPDHLGIATDTRWSSERFFANDELGTVIGILAALCLLAFAAS